MKLLISYDNLVNIFSHWPEKGSPIRNENGKKLLISYSSLPFITPLHTQCL